MTHKPRIALLCGDLSGAGGAERVIFEEAAELRARGHEVRVLTFMFSSDATFSGRYAHAVDVIPVRGRTALQRLVGAVVGLWRLFRDRPPDLVIAMSAHDCVRLFIPALMTRTPYITHINGTPFWFTPEQEQTKYARSYRKALRTVLEVSPTHAEFLPRTRPRIGWRRQLRIEMSVVLQRVAVRHARRRIAFSRRMAWEVELLYGRPCMTLKGAFPESILSYLPQHDPTSHIRRSGGPLILNINRLEPRKRVALVIEAFSLLVRDVPNAMLAIGGTGPLERELRELAAQCGVAEQVCFLGFVAEKELWDWLAASDVFVHPNWAEFAIAPYEALALGTNVVWSTEMELDPLLERYRHLLPADPDVASTAAQIKAALAVPRANLSERSILSDYTWERYVADLAAIVDREIAGVDPA